MDSQDNFLNPERIIASLNIAKGSVIADFGAGHGYFSIPFARATGPEGRVYAIEIQKAGLNIIRAKARLEHLLQIETIWSDLDRPNGSRLADGSADLVCIGNLLFQSEKKEAILAEARRVLKSGGRCLVIEWRTTGTALGPPGKLRVPVEAVKADATRAGLTFERELPVGAHHYGLLFTK